MTISVRGVIFGSRLPRYGVNFARRFTEEGAAASRELHRLNRAILTAPATCAGDITIKLSVFGSILTDYGEMIDGQAALWARLSEDVAAFTGPRMAEAA